MIDQQPDVTSANEFSGFGVREEQEGHPPLRRNLQGRIGALPRNRPELAGLGDTPFCFPWCNQPGHATHPRVPPVLLQVLFRLGQQVPFCDFNEGAVDGRAVDGAEETLDARSVFRSLAIPFPGANLFEDSPKISTQAQTKSSQPELEPKFAHPS